MRVVRGIVWVVMALLAVLAFICTGWVPLLVVALAVLLLPPIGWLSVVFAARKVSVALASKTTASRDAQVDVRLRVVNGSRIPLAHVRAVIQAHNLLTDEDARIAVSAALSPRSEVEVPVELVSSCCGRIACTIGLVRLFDPFRIFSWRVPCEEQRRLTVMPTLHSVYMRDVYAASPLSDTTVFSPYLKGSDLSEVFALREYEEGDELKRVHWKLSEKIDQMIVRDASLPLDNALLLFWDKGVGPHLDDKAMRANAMAEVMLALMEQLVSADVSFEVASNDIPAGSCMRAFVTDEADIYEVIGQLLSAPMMSASVSGIDEYCRIFGALSCSRLIYVCTERPESLESAIGMSEALLLVCDDGGEVLALPPVSEIHFPKDNARIALEIVGAM